MKPTKNWKRGEEGEKEWEYNGGDELVQGAPYACIITMKIILLMYEKSKNKFTDCIC
jgi:hypothetical protein